MHHVWPEGLKERKRAQRWLQNRQRSSDNVHSRTFGWTSSMGKSPRSDISSICPKSTWKTRWEPNNSVLKVFWTRATEKSKENRKIWKVKKKWINCWHLFLYQASLRSIQMFYNLNRRGISVVLSKGMHYKCILKEKRWGGKKKGER